MACNLYIVHFTALGSRFHHLRWSIKLSEILLRNLFYADACDRGATCGELSENSFLFCGVHGFFSVARTIDLLLLMLNFLQLQVWFDVEKAVETFKSFSIFVDFWLSGVSNCALTRLRIMLQTLPISWLTRLWSHSKTRNLSLNWLNIKNGVSLLSFGFLNGFCDFSNIIFLMDDALHIILVRCVFKSGNAIFEFWITIIANLHRLVNESRIIHFLLKFLKSIEVWIQSGNWLRNTILWIGSDEVTDGELVDHGGLLF